MFSFAFRLELDETKSSDKRDFSVLARLSRRFMGQGGSRSSRSARKSTDTNTSRSSARSNQAHVTPVDSHSLNASASSRRSGSGHSNNEQPGRSSLESGPSKKSSQNSSVAGPSNLAPSISKLKLGRLTTQCSSSRHSGINKSQGNLPKMPNKFTRMPQELWDDSALPIRNLNPKVLVTPVGFTERERSLLLSLFHQLQRHTKNVGIKYYVSLITLHPEIRHKFPNDNVASDAQVQSHALSTLQYLINLANYIDDDEAFNASITRLAEYHKKLDFNKEDVNVLNNVFLNIAMKEMPDYMFPESAYVLIMFLSTITTRMFDHIMELKNNYKKHQRSDGNPHGVLRHRLSSNMEEIFETITEWQTQVIQFHQKRKTNDRTQHTPRSKSIISLLGPCLPPNSNPSPSSSSASFR